MTEAELLSKLEKLDDAIKTEIEKLLLNNSKADIYDFVTSLDFNNFVLSLGGAELITQFSSSLNKELNNAVRASRKSLTAETVASISELSDRIRDAQSRTILGYFQSNTEKFKTGIIKSIVGGSKKKNIAESFYASFNLKDPKTDHVLTFANIQTQIQTAYADHSRIITRQIFSDSPEQRFKYIGGLVATSSEICEYLVNNQDPKGYTVEEINSGISTPFGDVNWYGRIPNYNCGHTWEAI